MSPPRVGVLAQFLSLCVVTFLTPAGSFDAKTPAQAKGEALLQELRGLGEQQNSFVEFLGVDADGRFIVAQLLWPLIEVDDVALDDVLSVSAGGRHLFGALFMFVYGVLCVVVMMNILIAMLSSTCAARARFSSAIVCE